MNTQFLTILISSLFLLALLPKASSFQPTQSRTQITFTSTGTSNLLPTPLLALHATSNKDDDFGNTGNTGAGGESYEGDVDWDAEWKKVVENRNQPSDRPGKYKNDVERAMLKTTKATAEQIKKVKIVKPDINIRSLQGDGKFWIAVLAIISIGISLISAAGVETYANSSETFYV
jgi:predicted pyridoxine 5'-phosphate oxidase superfamily flavin-nucleotide-binding protein